MNKQSAIRNPRSNIAIAGAGPAGASLAIRLAKLGIETVLIERESFPRQKLCGEFISPECLSHFASLGVLEGMLAAGGDRILETRFFETGGKSVSVPSRWFGQGDFALSLSRAEMDNQLLNRAREVGVTVLEGTAITDVESVEGRVIGVRTRAADGSHSDVNADIFVDATGRSRILAKIVEKKLDASPRHIKPGLVGFKAHLRGVKLERGLCEIYSFPGGYAGLSNVENGLFNLCFLIKAAIVRSNGNDAAATGRSRRYKEQAGGSDPSGRGRDRRLAGCFDRQLRYEKYDAGDKSLFRGRRRGVHRSVHRKRHGDGI